MAVVARAAALDGAGEAAAGEQRVDGVVARLGERTARGTAEAGSRQVVRGHKGSGASGEGGAAAAGLGGGERLAGVAICTPFDEEEQEKEESCSWGRVVSVREGMVRRLGPSRHPAELGFALRVKDRCVVEAGCLAY